MSALWLLIVVFAVWRVTSLIARERGPFAIGIHLRSAFGVYHRPSGAVGYDPSGELMLNPITGLERVDGLLHEVAQGLTCIWCCSVWVSLMLTPFLTTVAPELVFDGRSWLIVSLAVSGVVIVLENGREGQARKAG